MIRINYLTTYLSPHLLPLLNAFGEHPCVELKVWYCSTAMDFRKWKHDLEPTHSYTLSSKTPWSFLHPEFHLDTEILNFIRENPCDLTVVSEGDIPTLRIAIHYLNRTKRPWALRGERPQLWRNSLLRQLAGCLVRHYPLKTARAVIANGSWNAKIYRELCPWGTPVYSVPYYLDAEQYTQTSKNHSMQARLSLPKRNNDSIEFRFVFAGSLTRRKGVDRLARIFRKVTALSPHTILYVAGAGPCENEMKEILRGTPHDNVTFLGNLGMHEISTLFSFVNALVFPTQFDGWGMVVNEAMACGLPVITTTTCGAAHDLVSPGRNGYILEPNDDEGFVEKMVYLSRHPDVAKDMGQAARDSILEHSPKNGAEILYHACLDILQRS